MCVCARACVREHILQGSSSCLSDSPRTSALLCRSRFAVFCVTSVWKRGPAVQRKLWLPEGPPLYSELISKQGKGATFQTARSWEGSGAAGSPILPVISLGNMSAVGGRRLPLKALLQLRWLIKDKGTYRQGNKDHPYYFLKKKITLN